MNNNELQDITIKCRTCDEEFLFKVTEQLFFADKGFGAPIRCHDCRKAKRERNEERVAEVTKGKEIIAEDVKIDADEDWVAAMNASFDKQVQSFGSKE